jgi:hypothetical protein
MKYSLSLAARASSFFSLCFLLCSCASKSPPPPPTPATPFYPAKLAEMDAAINHAIADKK